METKIRKENGRAVVQLIGELDTAASRDAERDLLPLFTYEDCDILIDCGQLNYISSSGLRLMLSIYKHTRRTGHRALLANVGGTVEEVFRISGFMQLFGIES